MDARIPKLNDIQFDSLGKDDEGYFAKCYHCDEVEHLLHAEDIGAEDDPQSIWEMDACAMHDWSNFCGFNVCGSCSSLIDEVIGSVAKTLLEYGVDVGIDEPQRFGAELIADIKRQMQN